MVKKGIIIGLLFSAVVFILCLGIFKAFFAPNNKIVQAFDKSRVNLVIGGDVVNDGTKIVDDEVLIPFDIVKKYFDPNIYWDDNLKKVTITTKDKVIRMKTGSLNAFINNKPVNLKIPVTEASGVVYVPIEVLSDFYKIKITRIRENNLVVVDYKNNPVQIATAVKNHAVIRTGWSVHKPIIRKFDINNESKENLKMRVFGEHENWYKVRTTDGAVGYIEKKSVILSSLSIPETNNEENNDKTPWKPKKGKINLVWEMMYGGRPDLAALPDMTGLDVISPTWFRMVNDKGDLSSSADLQYVKWGHGKGYKIWALLSNDFSNPAATGRFLNNTDARDNLIRQILSYASLYKLDGINIDFENINKNDRDALSQFVREITPFLKEQGLIVSIDVNVPDGSDNYSKCYDMEAIGKVVDYVMLMAYDQHWKTCPEAGSVAQLSWVEYNLEKTLELIPKEKLILGLPFYTRLWKEETTSDGTVKVSSPKALTMEEARAIIADKKSTVTWDDESGQFYTEYSEGNAKYKIWLEDSNSIGLKASLTQKYNIAGAAGWYRKSGEAQVWPILNENLKVLKNYQEWQQKNASKKYSYN